jgi:transglutaminase-like putative cysteine protease
MGKKFNRRLSLAAACASFVLAGCGGTGTWTSGSVLSDAGLTALPDTLSYPDAGAVVLLDEGLMEIFSGDEVGFSALERHRIVRILNSRGQRYANVMIPYGSTSTVANIQARTLTRDGRSATLPAVEDGAVIEYSYRILLRDRAFWHSWVFQDDEPVLLSRFTLVKPAEWSLDSRSYGIPVEPTSTKAPAGFKSRHVWELRNIPPLHAEAAMPPVPELAARIALAPIGFVSWTDISTWYNGIAAPRLKGGPLIRMLADSLTRHTTDPSARLRALAEWVRDEVRYIAVEIGIGGFQPHYAEDIAEKRYGDCKDMVTLLCALAREANVEQGTWIDATDKACPFGTLPWYDQGMPVILARPPGENARARTPTWKPERNHSRLTWDVQLAIDGSSTVRGKSVLSGAVANELRYELLMSDRRESRTWIEAFLAQRIPGMELDTFSVGGLKPVEDPLTLSYTFHAPAFAQKRDSGLVIRPGRIAGFLLDEYFRSTDRTYPVRLRFGTSTDLELTIRLPAGWGLMRIRADSLNTPYGSGSWSMHNSPAGITIVIRHELLGGEVPARKYQDFRAFLDGVRLRDEQEVLLCNSCLNSVP